MDSLQLASELLECARNDDHIGIASYNLNPEAEVALRKLASLDAEIRRLEKALIRLEGQEAEAQSALEAALVNDGLARPRHTAAV